METIGIYTRSPKTATKAGRGPAYYEKWTRKRPLHPSGVPRSPLGIYETRDVSPEEANS